jgi:ribosome recycling factor
MIDDIINTAQARMNTAVQAFESELQGISGTASASMLDGIEVDYYGTPTPVSQIATVTVVDPRLLTVKPYDQSLLDPIYKAIRASSLGIIPEMDSELLRLPIGPLSLDAARELVKRVNALAEPARVEVRAARTDALDALAKAEITDDERTNGEKTIEGLTDGSIYKIDTSVRAKANELMSTTSG